MSELVGRGGQFVRDALKRIDPRGGSENKATQILFLPQDGDRIAEQYATHLNIPELEEPLGEFLQRASEIPLLDGIGLATWNGLQDPRLWIYVLSDLSQRGRPANPSAYSKVSQVYEDLYVKTDDLIQRTPFIRNTLNTKNITIEQYAKIFPNKLPPDSLFGTKTEPTEPASLATLLKISPPQTKDAPILDAVEQRLFDANRRLFEGMTMGPLTPGLFTDVSSAFKDYVVADPGSK